MIYEKIALYANDETRKDIILTSYVSEKSKEFKNFKKAAVLILPGGGYVMTSDREAEPIAKAFFGAGIDAFVLRYSVQEAAKDYAPLLDTATAIKFIRDNAERYNIDVDKILVCGFSAGGHLAASMGTLWDLPIIKENLSCDCEYVKPNGMILGYPVINGGEKGHRFSIDRVMGKTNGEKATQEDLDLFAIEKHVKANTCPAFIWHTADDSGVPVENALVISEALSANKVPFELHVFPKGPHGISLANREVSSDENAINNYVGRWLNFALAWIEETYFKKN